MAPAVSDRTWPDETRGSPPGSSGLSTALLASFPVEAPTLRGGSILDHGGRIAPPTPGALCSRSEVACQEGRQNFIARRPSGGRPKTRKSTWGTRTPLLTVIARSPCDEAIQGPRAVAPGLLRCARNDGGVIGHRLRGRSAKSDLAYNRFRNTQSVLGS